MDQQEIRPTVVGFGEKLLDKMVSAASKVRKRQLQIALTLEESCVSFALSGSNAAHLWVASSEKAAARQYRNVELIIKRKDKDILISEMHELGFTTELRPDRLVIRSTPNQRERCADVAFFANDLVRNTSFRIPSLDDTTFISGVRTLSLESLVELQLCRWTLDDRGDLRDMIDVGLLDQSWPSRLLPELAARLQELLDDPNG
jgi:hypothetical protein